MVNGSLSEVVCSDNCGVSLNLGRPPLRTRLLMLLPSPLVCVHLPPISLLSQVTATFWVSFVYVGILWKEVSSWSFVNSVYFSLWYCFQIETFTNFNVFVYSVQKLLMISLHHWYRELAINEVLPVCIKVESDSCCSKVKLMNSINLCYWLIHRGRIFDKGSMIYTWRSDILQQTVMLSKWVLSGNFVKRTHISENIKHAISTRWLLASPKWGHGHFPNAFRSSHEYLNCYQNEDSCAH